MEKKKFTGDNWYAIKMELRKLLVFNSFNNDKLTKQFSSLKTIYHYTTLNGLISIIDNQCIFCTNINFLNDKMEFEHGVNLILGVIDKLKKENFELEILSNVVENINLIYKSERYVTCFSKNGDLLSQWRAYANYGKGVSIGFNKKKFGKSVIQAISGRHIEYDENFQLQIIEELIKKIIEFFNQRKELIDWGEHQFELLISSVIIEFLRDIIGAYKSPLFKEEQEYRFEYEIDGERHKKGKEKLLFRASDTLIIPYIKLKSKYLNFLEKNEQTNLINNEIYLIPKVGRLPINEIIVGPSLDFESIKSGIEELLVKHEYKNVEIKKSEIPFRI